MHMNTKQEIRNIGIFAHVDAGKTTTTERILYYSGVLHKIGEVDSGTAVMDWMAQEQNRGITITSAATKLLWRECQINIIDTPGHVDFTAEVERCLRVLDGGVAIFDAVNGVEPQSETVWRQAARYGIPRLVFVNKMDRVGADFDRACRSIVDVFGVRLLKLFIPVGAERDFQGVIDVLGQAMLWWGSEDQGKEVHRRDVPPQWQEDARQAYNELIEQLADESDTIAEQYLGGGEVDAELCHTIVRRLVHAEAAFPVFCGASLRNIGVQPLMDAIVAYLPPPDELPDIIATTTAAQDGAPLQEVRIVRSVNQPLSALIFKISCDRGKGDFAYIRVYAGRLQAGQKIYNASLGIYERIHQLRLMHANSSTQVSEIVAGDIGVAIGFKKSRTGDTLTTKENAHLLENIIFPEPVISSSIEPQTQSDRDHLLQVLSILSKEDPTFRWKEDSDTGELIIAGMGELHLSVLSARIADDFKVAAKIGTPQVAYRERIQRVVRERSVLQFQLAGAEHRMAYTCTVGPTEHDDGVKNEITIRVGAGGTRLTDGMMDAEQHAVAVRAAEGALNSGFLLGYPAIQTKVEMEIDEIVSGNATVAIEAAVSRVVSALCQRADPVQLEPVMTVSVITPREYVGEVLSGLQQRNGSTTGVRSLPSGEKITATAPLARLFGYSTAIRSATKGRGEFNITFARFAPLV